MIEIFYSLKDAQILTWMWRRQYDTIRLQSALDYLSPVLIVFVVLFVQVAISGLIV